MIIFIFIIIIIPTNTTFCKIFTKTSQPDLICFIKTSGQLTYDDMKNYAISLNARLPYKAELDGMINLNGYSQSNFPFQSDKWVPVMDRDKYYMQIGDSRIGAMVSSPFWG